MILQDIIEMLDARFICGNECQNMNIEKAAASDLMSDVLTLMEDDVLLITGLCNMQTIRTAEMADISHIIIVRDKQITPEMINLARKSNICLVQTAFSMLKTCGLLWEKGIKSLY